MMYYCTTVALSLRLIRVTGDSQAPFMITKRAGSPSSRRAGAPQPLISCSSPRQLTTVLSGPGSPSWWTTHGMATLELCCAAPGLAGPSVAMAALRQRTKKRRVRQAEGYHKQRTHRGEPSQ